AIQNIYVSRRCANVQQRDDVSWLRVVVQFITVLKGKGVHVNHGRLLAVELNRLLQIRNFVTLASSHKDVDFVRRAASNVIVEIDVRDIKRSEEHTSELQSRGHLVCRLLLEKKKKKDNVRANMNCKCCVNKI